MKPAKKRPARRRVLQKILAKARALIEGENADRWCSAGGVVWAQGRVAVIRQKNKWTFPKGRVDPGESLSGAARREVLEETGLKVSVTEYLGVVEGARHETHFFLMALRFDGGRHDDEVDEVRFVKPFKARKLLSARRDRRVLDRALAALEGRLADDPHIG